MAKNKERAAAAAQRETLASTVEQLDGVLICALAACHAEPNTPAAITSAIWAAARLSGEARRGLVGA